MKNRLLYISTFNNELMFLTEVQPTEALLVVRALEQGGLVGLQQLQAALSQSDGGGGGTH